MSELIVKLKRLDQSSLQCYLKSSNFGLARDGLGLNNQNLPVPGRKGSRRRGKRRKSAKRLPERSGCKDNPVGSRDAQTNSPRQQSLVVSIQSDSCVPVTSSISRRPLPEFTNQEESKLPTPSNESTGLDSTHVQTSRPNSSNEQKNSSVHGTAAEEASCRGSQETAANVLDVNNKPGEILVSIGGSLAAMPASANQPVSSNTQKLQGITEEDFMSLFLMSPTRVAARVRNCTKHRTSKYLYMRSRKLWEKICRQIADRYPDPDIEFVKMPSVLIERRKLIDRVALLPPPHSVSLLSFKGYSETDALDRNSSPTLPQLGATTSSALSSPSSAGTLTGSCESIVAPSSSSRWPRKRRKLAKSFKPEVHLPAAKLGDLILSGTYEQDGRGTHSNSRDTKAEAFHHQITRTWKLNHKNLYVKVNRDPGLDMLALKFNSSKFAGSPERNTGCASYDNPETETLLSRIRTPKGTMEQPGLLISDFSVCGVGSSTDCKQTPLESDTVVVPCSVSSNSLSTNSCGRKQDPAIDKLSIQIKKDPCSEGLARLNFKAQGSSGFNHASDSIHQQTVQPPSDFNASVSVLQGVEKRSTRNSSRNMLASQTSKSIPFNSSAVIPSDSKISQHLAPKQSLLVSGSVAVPCSVSSNSLSSSSSEREGDPAIVDLSIKVKKDPCLDRLALQNYKAPGRSGAVHAGDSIQKQSLQRPSDFNTNVTVLEGLGKRRTQNSSRDMLASLTSKSIPFNSSAVVCSDAKISQHLNPNQTPLKSDGVVVPCSVSSNSLSGSSSERKRPPGSSGFNHASYSTHQQTVQPPADFSSSATASEGIGRRSTRNSSRAILASRTPEPVPSISSAVLCPDANLSHDFEECGTKDLSVKLIKDPCIEQLAFRNSPAAVGVCPAINHGIFSRPADSRTSATRAESPGKSMMASSKSMLARIRLPPVCKAGPQESHSSAPSPRAASITLRRVCGDWSVVQPCVDVNGNTDRFMQPSGLVQPVAKSETSDLSTLEEFPSTLRIRIRRSHFSPNTSSPEGRRKTRSHASRYTANSSCLPTSFPAQIVFPHSTMKHLEENSSRSKPSRRSKLPLREESPQELHHNENKNPEKRVHPPVKTVGEPRVLRKRKKSIVQNISPKGTSEGDDVCYSPKPVKSPRL